MLPGTLSTNSNGNNQQMVFAGATGGANTGSLLLEPGMTPTAYNG